MHSIMQAIFGATRSAKTAPLYQWDYGQKLEIIGVTLPDYFEAHFSNSEVSGTALTVIGYSNVADIPDELLTTGQDVWCWVYLHDAATDGETEYTIRIPVKARPMRDSSNPVYPSEWHVVSETQTVDTSSQNPPYAAELTGTIPSTLPDAIIANMDGTLKTLDFDPVTGTTIANYGSSTDDYFIRLNTISDTITLITKTPRTCTVSLHYAE